jgi:hypothetical protein
MARNYLLGALFPFFPDEGFSTSAIRQQLAAESKFSSQLRAQHSFRHQAIRFELLYNEFCSRFPPLAPEYF